MSTLPVKISLEKSGRAAVEVAGVDVAGSVTRLDLSVEAGPDPAALTLQLRPGLLTTVSGDADVVVAADTAEVVVRLGWTPPGRSS